MSEALISATATQADKARSLPADRGDPGNRDSMSVD
jgi:hypothetical protein